VALVGSRDTLAAWERPLGAADALSQPTGGATFGWEHFAGERNTWRTSASGWREGDWGAAYRHGAYAAVRASRCPGFTLLEEVAPGAICDGRTAEAPMAAQTI
jgi:hypothetical protein